MFGLVLVTLALTTSGQLHVPTTVDHALGPEAVLTGKLFSKEGTLFRASGEAVLRSGTTVLRADEMTYDQETRVATAHGNVLLVFNGLIGFAKDLTVNLETREVTAPDATFYQKQGVAPEVLTGLAARGETLTLQQSGSNAFSFTTDHFRLLENRAYQVDNLSFSASCGCDVVARLWSVNASSATLQPGERASFSTPTVRILGVPIVWLPLLSLPLTNRATGLLFPEFGASGLSGFQIAEPLFLTLGQSYDMTLSPGYAFGRESDASGKGSPGVRGPFLDSEFRYAPAEGVNGRLSMRLLYDFKLDRTPLDPNVLEPDAKQRGLRGWGSVEHRQELGNGWHTRADVTLYSDGYLFSDTTPAAVFGRSYYYLPSTASLYHRAEDHYAGLDLAYRQDIRFGFPLFGGDDDPLRPPVFQRLPRLLYTIPTVPLLGPLTGSVDVELSRLSPLGGRLGDEGTDGVFWPALPDADGTQGNGRLDPGERQARTRLDVRPRLNATFDVGGVLRATPYLAVRESLYLFEVSRETRSRTYGMAGLTLDTELSRTFGEGASAIRHTIMPAVELRAVPRVFGEKAPTLYDEVDAAVTPDGFFQGQVALRQKLVRRVGTSGTAEIGRFDLTQGVDFLERRMGETSGRILAVVGPVTATATARLDLFTPNVEQRLTQLSSMVNWTVLTNGRLNVGAGYERALGSSERVRRPIDMLLPPPLTLATTPVTSGGSCSDTTELNKRSIDRVLFNAGTHLPFGLGVSYDAEVYRRDPARCDVVQMNRQTLSLSYTPSCDCFSIAAHASLMPAPVYFDYGVLLTVKGLGTFGR